MMEACHNSPVQASALRSGVSMNWQPVVYHWHTLVASCLMPAHAGRLPPVDSLRQGSVILKVCHTMHGQIATCDCPCRRTATCHRHMLVSCHLVIACDGSQTSVGGM